ncbi:MAG: SIMPL domain-containing protein [Alistipes sp.]|jgi:uncharacterized protein YggE|nr:SIMPL domain-containing protein [Alistipes sp.]
MRKFVLIAVLALMGTSAWAQEIAPRYEESIQVNGRAERKITPDEIWVAITIRDSDNKNLGVDGLEARMRREFAALGIDVAASLRVTSMANAPRKRSQIDTTRSYELKVGDAATLGRVFEALGEMDVVDAGVVRLGHSRIEQLRSEVRVEAVRNARNIAVELAGALDQRVGSAVWIVDNGFYESSPAPLYKSRAFAADAMYVSASGINDGGESALEMQEITLTYNVMAKFALLGPVQP